MTFKRRTATQIAKIGLSLFQNPLLSIFFLRGSAGSDVELRMEIATIVVTAVQVLPNPVHKETCWNSGGWASFTLLKAKLEYTGTSWWSHLDVRTAMEFLCVILPEKKGGLGFKRSREGKIGENTKDFWSAPQQVDEQPLNCGFAFRMSSNTAHWNMLEFIIHPYEIWASKNWWMSCRFSQGTFVLSQEKGHPFHPQWAVPTSHILSS